MTKAQELYAALADALDEEAHGPDCILRCLADASCRADHHCGECSDGDEDDDIPTA